MTGDMEGPWTKYQPSWPHAFEQPECQRETQDREHAKESCLKGCGVHQVTTGEGGRVETGLSSLGSAPFCPPLASPFTKRFPEDEEGTSTD